MSDLFAVAEMEVLGYPMTGGNDSATPCPLRCRHGGKCVLPSSVDEQSEGGTASCSCPSAQWGWTGSLCRICNRTATPSHYELFSVPDPMNYVLDHDFSIILEFCTVSTSDQPEQVDVEAPVQPTIFNAWRRLTTLNGGSSVKVAQLQRAYDELADPIRRSLPPSSFSSSSPSPSPSPSPSLALCVCLCVGVCTKLRCLCGAGKPTMRRGQRLVRMDRTSRPALKTARLS